MKQDQTLIGCSKKEERMNQKGKKYLKVCTGVKKNVLTRSKDTKKYIAEKKIKGKYYSEAFYSLKEAKDWYRTFNEFSPTSSHLIKRQNGYCEKVFSQVWGEYLKFQSGRIGLPSFQKLKVIYNSFDTQLTSLKVNEITTEKISDFLTRKKIDTSKKRYSYDQELKKLRAFFNFITGTIDPYFRSPINRYHFEMGVIVKKEDRKLKRKVLTTKELHNFLNELPELYRIIAEVLFSIAGRVSEGISLNIKNVDFLKRTITVRDVAVICYHSKKVVDTKKNTKNGEIRITQVSNELIRKLSRLEVNDEGFFFHKNGEILSYRNVQFQFDRALKKLGLYEEISGTHIFRYTSGSIVRNALGIDYTMAITGHKDIKMAQHYGKLDVSEKNKASSVVLDNILKLTSADLSV